MHLKLSSLPFPGQLHRSTCKRRLQNTKILGLKLWCEKRQLFEGVLDVVWRWAFCSSIFKTTVHYCWSGIARRYVQTLSTMNVTSVNISKLLKKFSGNYWITSTYGVQSITYIFQNVVLCPIGHLKLDTKRIETFTHLSAYNIHVHTS